MARAIFKSWFVDFDPVRAKLALSEAEGAEGRQPFGMDVETAALFPDSFQDSALGKIPRGWTIKRLKDVAIRVTKGTTPTTLGKMFVAEGVNFVKVESISETGCFITERFVHIDEETNELLARSVLQEGDILYTIAGTIGRIARVPQFILPANTNQAVAIIRPDRMQVEPDFVRYSLALPETKQRLLARVVHAVQPNLSLGILGEVSLICPGSESMKRLFAPINAISASIEANKAQSRTLATIRDTLLPKLISGEIRVKDAEKFIGATT
jgi:type I restriction enzyme S subunit